MALTKPITKRVNYISDFDADVITKDLEFPATYIRIENVRGNKTKMSINVITYTDGSKNKVLEAEMYSFLPSVDDNAKNFIEQGYMYLKTLEQFADAEDC